MGGKKKAGRSDHDEKDVREESGGGSGDSGCDLY